MHLQIAYNYRRPQSLLVYCNAKDSPFPSVPMLLYSITRVFCWWQNLQHYICFLIVFTPTGRGIIGWLCLLFVVCCLRLHVPRPISTEVEHCLSKEAVSEELWFSLCVANARKGVIFGICGGGLWSRGRTLSYLRHEYSNQNISYSQFNETISPTGHHNIAFTAQEFIVFINSTWPPNNIIIRL